MSNDDSEFERCLQLLRGPQDEHRFAGLLWAPRFLEQGVYDPTCAKDRIKAHVARAGAIYDAVGSRFLLRLLRTHSREGDPFSYVKLALSVLASLGVIPEAARATVPMLGPLVQLIPQFPPSSAPNAAANLAHCLAVTLRAASPDVARRALTVASGRQGIDLVANHVATLACGEEASTAAASHLAESAAAVLPAISVQDPLLPTVDSVQGLFSASVTAAPATALAPLQLAAAICSPLESRGAGETAKRALCAYASGGCGERAWEAVWRVLGARVEAAQRDAALSLWCSLGAARGGVGARWLCRTASATRGGDRSEGDRPQAEPVAVCATLASIECKLLLDNGLALLSARAKAGGSGRTDGGTGAAGAGGTEGDEGADDEVRETLRAQGRGTELREQAEQLMQSMDGSHGQGRDEEEEDEEEDEEEKDAAHRRLQEALRTRRPGQAWTEAGGSLAQWPHRAIQLLPLLARAMERCALLLASADPGEADDGDGAGLHSEESAQQWAGLPPQAVRGLIRAMGDAFAAMLEFLAKVQPLQALLADVTAAPAATGEAGGEASSGGGGGGDGAGEEAARRRRAEHVVSRRRDALAGAWRKSDEVVPGLEAAVMACASVVGTWLQEEAEGMRDRVRQATAPLVQWAPIGAASVADAYSGRISGEVLGRDPLLPLAPALAALAQEDDSLARKLLGAGAAVACATRGVGLLREAGREDADPRQSAACLHSAYGVLALAEAALAAPSGTARGGRRQGEREAAAASAVGPAAAAVTTCAALLRRGVAAEEALLAVTCLCHALSRRRSASASDAEARSAVAVAVGAVCGGAERPERFALAGLNEAARGPLVQWTHAAKALAAAMQRHSWIRDAVVPALRTGAADGALARAAGALVHRDANLADALAEADAALWDAAR